MIDLRAPPSETGSSIYDLLNKIDIEDATITQLNTATGRTAIDTEAIEFWKGVLTVAHTMKQSRTFEGLPIAESGAVLGFTIADGAGANAKPTVSSEIWLVNGIHLDGCQVALYDGSTACPIASVQDIRTPLYITEKMYIAFNNASGSEASPAIAYHKVSL